MDMSWLATKYSILGREAAARELEAQTQAKIGGAQAGLIGAQTQMYGPEAAARIAQMRSGAGLSSAQAGLTGEQQRMLPLSTFGGLNLTAAQAQLQRAQAGYWGAMSGEGFAGGTSDVPMMGPNGPFVAGGVGMPPRYAGGSPDVRQPKSSAPKPKTSSGNPKQPIEARSGKDKVPGQGSGKVDTQHAMLAPGEAVLNKAAAEYLGRATIDVLNHVGRIKMGMDPNGAPSDTSTHQQAVKPGQGQSKMPSESGGEGMGFDMGGIVPPVEHQNHTTVPGWAGLDMAPPTMTPMARPSLVSPTGFKSGTPLGDVGTAIRDLGRHDLRGGEGGYGGVGGMPVSMGLPGAPAGPTVVRYGVPGFAGGASDIRSQMRTWDPLGEVSRTGSPAPLPPPRPMGLGINPLGEVSRTGSPAPLPPPRPMGLGINPQDLEYQMMAGPARPAPSGYAGGVADVPPAPSGASEAIHPLLAFVLGTSGVPSSRDIANRKGGKDPTVSKPGSDVMDRWNTGLPMYAAGTSKVPAKGAPKGKGKAAGLTPGLVAALLGAGVGGPQAGAPGAPPALGPSMPMAAPAMGR